MFNIKKALKKESEYFTKVSKFRFQDLGFSHPFIDVQAAIKAGKQIMRSPYAEGKDAHIDGWMIKSLPQWHKLQLLVSKAVSKPQAKVIDVGCGAGNIALEMARQGANVTGIDLCQESIRIANLSKKNSQASIKGSLNYSVANINKVNWPDNSLDAIVLVSTIHHLPEVDKFISRVYKSLKQTGCLLIFDHYIIDRKWISHLKGAMFLLLWLVKPGKTSPHRRFIWVFGSIMKKLGSNYWRKRISPMGIKMTDIVQQFQKKNHKLTGPALKLSPYDNASSFYDYLPQIKKLFSGVEVEFFNAFKAQSFIYKMSPNIPTWFKRITAFFICGIEDLICRAKIVKGYNVLITAKK